MGKKKESTIVEEIESVIKGAAGGQKVVVIRLAAGKGISMPQTKLARDLHKLFPEASIEIENSSKKESVVVKDIEVE